MGRIYKEIQIEGKPATALFDTGATLSYVRRDLVSKVPKYVCPRPYRVGLGGREIEVRKVCFASAQIDGLRLHFEAAPVDDLGNGDGHRIDAIIGALTMERWDIRLNPKKRTLDLQTLRRGEYTEY